MGAEMRSGEIEWRLVLAGHRFGILRRCDENSELEDDCDSTEKDSFPFWHA
jgi:hypothetical protein